MLNNPPEWLQKLIRDCEVSSERINGDSENPYTIKNVEVDVHQEEPNN